MTVCTLATNLTAVVNILFRYIVAVKSPSTKNMTATEAADELMREAMVKPEATCLFRTAKLTCR